MWEGELCFSPARGVGSEGSGGVPPAVYADPDFSFFFFFSSIRLEGVSNPSIRVTQPTK